MAKDEAKPEAKKAPPAKNVAWLHDDSIGVRHADFVHYRIIGDQVLLTFGHFDVGPEEDPEPPLRPVNVRVVSRLSLSQSTFRSVSRLFKEAEGLFPSGVQPEKAK